MPHDHKPVQVQMKSGMLLQNEAVGGTDILKRAGPSSIEIAYTPVFGVEGRDPGGSQRLAQVSGVREVILRAPIAAVDVQENGARTLGARQTDFEKLIYV